MKEAELRQHANCTMCGNPIGHMGALDFYVITVEQYIVDPGALRRQTGLAMAMGSAALAQVMGRDEKLAHLTMQRKVTACQECALGDRAVIEAFAMGDDDGEGEG